MQVDIEGTCRVRNVFQEGDRLRKEASKDTRIKKPTKRRIFKDGREHKKIALLPIYNVRYNLLIEIGGRPLPLSRPEYIYTDILPLETVECPRALDKGLYTMGCILDPYRIGSGVA